MENKSTNEKIPTAERIPVKRLVSKRDIGIEAFELENGNMMLEATFLDPYHLIRLNLHINPKTKTIILAKSEFANHPHRACPVVEIKAQLLVGLKIERGVTRKVSERIGGSEGCIHLRELTLETINFAATALVGYDEGFGLMSRDFNMLNEDKKFEISKGLLKGSCSVYNRK